MPKQFYFKQLSLAYVQFFVYKQLNVETLLFQENQFSISTQFKFQISSISNNSVSHEYAV